MTIKRIFLSVMILFMCQHELQAQNITATIKAGSCDSCIVLYVTSDINAKVPINNFNISFSVDDAYQPVIVLKNDSMLTGHKLSTASFDYPGKAGSTLTSYDLNGRRYYDLVYNNSSSATINDSTIFQAGKEHPLVELKLTGLNNHTLVEAKLQFNDLTNEGGGNNWQSFFYTSVAGAGNDAFGSITPAATHPLFYSVSNQNILGVNAANDQYIQLTNIIISLPLTFLSVEGYRSNDNITINWKVENEMHIREYKVERSSNGINFSEIQTVVAKGSGSVINYTVLDNAPLKGSNFYRIKSIGADGEIKYSNVISVGIVSDEQISLFPNPANEDGFNIRFANSAEGVYGVKVFDVSGKLIISKTYQHHKGSITEFVSWERKPEHGNYSVQITGPDNLLTSLKLLF